MSKYHAAIVGGGPNALYMLERLYNACLAHGSFNLIVTVIDKKGNFGSGCHYSGQPITNHLNRIAAQIGFCGENGPLSYGESFITLYDWCKKKYDYTKENKYKVDQEDWVPRSLFGEVSEDVFKRIADLLKNDLGIEVATVVATVQDINKNNDDQQYCIYLESGEVIGNVDHVILCTGHNYDQAADAHFFDQISQHLKNNSAIFFTNYIYPIEKRGFHNISPVDKLLIRGMGLAAFDLILYLTEGRGGQFISDPTSVIGIRYIPSGKEPNKIALYSDSGVFLYTKARNQKLNDVNLYHQGKYFQDENINRIRASVGKPIDFHKQVLPLIIVEMFYVYYSTLYGNKALEIVLQLIDKSLDDWFINLDGNCESSYEKILIEPQRWINSLAIRLDSVVKGKVCVSELDETSLSALRSYVSVCYGNEYLYLLDNLNKSNSNYFNNIFQSVEPSVGYKLLPSEFYFDYNLLVSPMCGAGAPYASKDIFLQDILRARKGNITDPVKACIDGVLRDCRDTLRLAVESGGLSAKSSSFFFKDYVRVINRLAVGTSLKVMEKIFAIVDAGIVDLRQTRINNLIPTHNGFECEWADGTREMYNCLTFASLHKFNLHTTSTRLYQNILKRGMIREYVLRDEDGFEFNSGCVETYRDTQCVIDENGCVNSTLNILGLPTEGQKFFHVAAVRPYCQDPVITDVAVVTKSIALRSVVKSSKQMITS